MLGEPLHLGHLKRHGDRDALQQRAAQHVEPRAGRAGREQHWDVLPQPFAPCRGSLRRRLGCHEVDLREGEDARQRGEPRVVRGQLALDRRVVLDRVGAVDRCQVEHVHEQARALDVREEVVPEAGALARALDQPWDVGQHELAVPGVDRAEHRLERRERIVGDLRRRAGETGQQRGLAGVRQADEADVGEQLQAQLDPAFLARKPALGEARGLARRRREVLVAAAGRAASRHDGYLAGRHEVVARAVLQLGDRARRDVDLQPLALRPEAQRPSTVAAASGLEVRGAAEELEVAQRVVAHQHDVAPAPAVATVRPALRHARLAPERHAAVAAAAGLDVDSGSVGEHRAIVTGGPSGPFLL